METTQIKQLIVAGLPGSLVEVNGDGQHFQAVVISEQFAGKSRVAQQQLVYATVNSQLASGELHALSIKPYTPQQWSELNG